MKTLIKESFVTIKKSFKRYLSLLLIVLLGVGFFAGIKATSPDMKATINNYYEETNFYDIYLASTWGISKDEVSDLNIKGYKTEGSYEIDMLTDEQSEIVVKVLSYDEKSNINKLVLKEGKLPVNDNECVIEYNDYNSYKNIGDKIKVQTDELNNKEMTIVGKVSSPIFTSVQRGTTKLLNGSISFFIYTPITNFNGVYYTNAYVNINTNLNTYSSKYKKIVDSDIDKLKIITDTYGSNRFIDEKTEATNKLNTAKEEYESQKEKYTNQIKAAKKQIASAKKELKDGYVSLNKAKSDYETSKTAANQKKEDLNNNLNTINNQIDSLEISRDNIQHLIDNGIDVSSNTILLNQINSNLNSLNNSKDQINSAIKSINDSLTMGEVKINETEDKLNSSALEISQNEKKIQNEEKTLNQKLIEAEAKIADSEKKINELEEPTWYVYDRSSSNVGFNEYEEDANRIKNIAKLFPIVFYVVAILVCLTSMTRMVEEDRSLLGTLKSLGYNNKQITMKYIIYSLSASVIGSILGVIIGFAIIPPVIFNMYGMMYRVGDFVNEFNYLYALIGSLCAILCVTIASLYVCKKNLKESPAELLRPKAPKPGKRVLLERITFIWNKLSFIRKVTVRNIFRYKKRFLMTIVGIAGCTGLVLAGFGLRDCITGMVPNQYQNIFNYQGEITLKDISTDSKNKINEDIKNISSIKGTSRVLKESVSVKNKDDSQSISLIVPQDDISNYIKIQNRKTKEAIKLDDKAIMTEKIMKLLDISENDKITIETKDKNIDVKVSQSAENYLFHYIYLSNNIYQSEDFNTIYFKTNEMTEEEERNLSKEIMNMDGVSSIGFSSSMEHIFDDTMKNFGYVAVVLIISAGLLAFVVLYNLASVNISERKRELATIKVLGFYDKEVYDYLDRETKLLTVIGMILGLGLGVILTAFIIKTCEVDIIMFSSKINWYSYVYSILITLVFTSIVNIIIYHSLKKIDMIESLKSVE